MTHSTEKWLGLPLLLLMAVLLVGLLSAVEPSAFVASVSHPQVRQAAVLSLMTSSLAMLFVVFLGLPLAWSLSRRDDPPLWLWLLRLPVVLPPSVVGLALLFTFGARGLVGSHLGSMAYTLAGLVLTQVVVAAPFFVEASAGGFREADEELLLISQTLGASRFGALRQVALPLALPSLVSGIGLAWARALGEFGATLIFVGALSGHTETLPVAIYAALQTDVSRAIAAALLLVVASLFILLITRGVAKLLRRA